VSKKGRGNMKMGTDNVKMGMVVGREIKVLRNMMSD
jgi:hypothetical protein